MAWNLPSILLTGFFFILSLFSWSALPRFSDIYYHLLVMLGFHQAGGMVLRDFLQYAPVGRPQLYPPLFPGMLLAMFDAGLDPILIARLTKVIIFPGLLVIVWLVIKMVFGKRQAFFTVLVATSSYSFYSACISLIPATLACILSLLSFRALVKNRPNIAGLLSGLIFYAHSLMAWILLIAIGLYCCFNQPQRKNILRVILIPVCLGLPITAYQFFNRSLFTFIPPPSYATIEVSIFIFIFAIAGLVTAIKRGGPYYFLVSLVIAMSLLQVSYFSRFLSGHGMLGFILLAGLGLEYFYQKLCLPASGKRMGILFASAAFLLFSVINPALSFSKDNKKRDISLSNSLAINLLTPQAISGESQAAINSERLMEPVRETIESHSGDRDIIYSNVGTVGCYLSIITGRATSNALLPEVKPYAAFDPVAAARIIIWVKSLIPGKPGEPGELIARYGLSKINETEACYIYLNSASVAKKDVPRAIIPTPVLFAMMLGAFFVPLVWLRV